MKKGEKFTLYPFSRFSSSGKGFLFTFYFIYLFPFLFYILFLFMKDNDDICFLFMVNNCIFNNALINAFMINNRLPLSYNNKTLE